MEPSVMSLDIKVGKLTNVRNFGTGNSPSLLLCVFLFFCFLSPVYSQAMTEDQWLDIGWDYYNAGDIDEAFSTFLEAVDLYPESAEAHLALGEIYLEMEVIDRGRAELLKSLELDDESSLAARAHYSYAYSIREEDTWTALMHLNRAHEIPASPTLHLEIAQQVRFCTILLGMQGRSESGDVNLHYADYLITSGEGDHLAQQAEADLYLAESFCFFNITEPFHIFLYPSERAVRAEIMFEEDDFDPIHREFHVPLTTDIDFLPIVCAQIVSDLQDELNRHAGSEWVLKALPTAVRRTVPWGDSSGVSESESEDEVRASIDCNSAVLALREQDAYVELRYLLSEEYSAYIPDLIFRAELGCFLVWVRRNYDTTHFQELLTQPNVDIVLDADIADIEERWLEDVAANPNLITDPEVASMWAESQPLSTLAGDPELPMRILKDGLRLYLEGEEILGLREIHRALDIDPGLAVGYYTLGWIDCIEGDWDGAEDNLGMALMLFEDTNQLAWCHALLAPVYLSEERWDIAQASLGFVATYCDADDVRVWASGLLERVLHIQSIRPRQDSSDPELVGTMTQFMDSWNVAANSDNGVGGLVSGMMDSMRAGSITMMYKSIRDVYPSVVFSHEITAASLSGSAVLMKILVHAEFASYPSRLPDELQPLVEDGYPIFFQLVPSEDGWVVLDWEDGWFPLAPVARVMPESPQFEEFE